MFDFNFTLLAKEQLGKIKRDKGFTKRYKAVLSALGKFRLSGSHFLKKSYPEILDNMNII